MSTIKLKALPNYALIQLPKKYESGLMADKDKYSTNSTGILIQICIPDNFPERELALYKTFKDKTVYFTPFEDGEEIKLDDKEYVFIPISALRGGLF